MNASFRHEDSATFPARTAGSAHLAAGRGRRRFLGMVLVTGMTAGGAAIATADGEPNGLAALGFGAKPAAAPAAPAAPLPPAANEPAGSDASRVISPAPAPVTAGRPDSAKPAPERLSLWSPLQAIGLVPTPKPQPEAAPAPRVATVQQLPSGRAAAGDSVGRFDPELGTAAYVVSDGQVAAEAARPQAWDGQATAVGPQPQPLAGGLLEDGGLDEPTRSVSVSDEPVSLVSWLATQCSGQPCGKGGSCPDVCGKDPCCKDPCCPTWEVQVDALFLWQGNIPSRPLYLDSLTQQPVLDVNQLQNRAAIAPRYAIIFNRDECRAIEANYFQVWGFNADQSAGPRLIVDPQTGNTVGAFQTNNLPVPFYDQISSAQATSSAHIQSLEVNLRQRDGGMITWLTGFRWVEWGQNLGISDVQYVNDPNLDPPLNTAADIFNVSTLNSLYGWQWGADMMLWNAGRWLRINGVGKAGVYYNHQALQNTFYNNLNDPPVSVGASKDAVAFVGETGVNCSWSITNWLSWRAGYSLFWLSGVAVPANQLSITKIDAFAPETSTAAVNATGSVLIHGVTTGLEARW